MTTVEYGLATGSTDTLEAIYDGAHIASIEPGSHDLHNDFRPDLPGFTISYGRGFERSKWCASLDAAKAWIERKADDLRDY